MQAYGQVAADAMNDSKQHQHRQREAEKGDGAQQRCTQPTDRRRVSHKIVDEMLGVRHGDPSPVFRSWRSFFSARWVATLSEPTTARSRSRLPARTVLRA